MTCITCCSPATVQFWRDGDSWLARTMDGPLRGLHSLSVITGVSSQLTGNESVNKTAQSAINAFGTTLCTLSMIRPLFAYCAKLLPHPGCLFWQINKDYTWKRADHQQLLSTDNPSLNSASIYVPRSWLDVASDVSWLAYRLFSPVCWLEYIQAIHLKEHSQWVGGLVFTLLGVACTLSLAQAVRDITSGQSIATLQKLVWEVVHSILELICLPFEFGLGSHQPTLALVGAALAGITACSSFAKEVLFYG